MIGGGPAAHAAAGAYREAGGTLPLRMLAAESHAPYRRPPLTKEYLRGESGRGELPLEPGEWYRRREIEIELDAEVVGLDLERGRAVLADGRGLGCERCLLATGSRPLVPPIPGADGARVLTVRTIGDSERLATLGGGRVLVAGSGFIGCEAAASLAMLGAETVLATLEAAPQVERLGGEAAERIGGWLQRLGVELLPEASLVELAEGAGEIRASFEDGRARTADAVLLALGIERNDRLARDAGLAGEEGVLVDAAMVSSHPDLLAAGDVALAHNATAGRRLSVEHWGEALNMGRVAGRTLAGREAAWDAVPGFWSTIGERTLKYAGWGDGWEEARFEAGEGESFSISYGSGGELVGILAHRDDRAYEEGKRRIEERDRWS